MPKRQINLFLKIQFLDFNINIIFKKHQKTFGYFNKIKFIYQYYKKLFILNIYL